MERPIRHNLSIVLLIACSVLSTRAVAASEGHLKGLIQDESGRPLPNLLISLWQKSNVPGLPLLARTNHLGQIVLQNIESGIYELQIKSSRYQSSQPSVVEILPGQTAMVTLVLQQLFRLEGSTLQNLSVKALMRTSTDRRLIFRNLPGVIEGLEDRQKLPFQNAMFEVYTNAGLRSDYLIFPSDSASGTSTNFAFTDRLLGNSTYILAGQLNSGEDSLWRLKNLVNYELGNNHRLQLFLGYSRMSFDQPSLALLGNPIAIGNSLDFINAAGAMKILSVGFEDTLRWGDTLAVIWGLELNQVRTARNYYFASPSAEVSFSPLRRTTVRGLVASKRSTHGNTLNLMDDVTVNLSNAVFFSRVGNQFSLGTSRHYQGSLAQKLTDSTEVEFARYRNELFGGTVPFLAVLSYRKGAEVLQLDDEQADNRGYRVTMRQSIGDYVKTSVSYTRGDAMGIAGQKMTIVFNEAGMRKLIGRRQYHVFATQLETHIPQSKTRLMAMVKVVPKGNPITTVDTFSDTYETFNKGVDLFVRQIIPVPPALLSFLGLDLSAYKLEALLDIRNLTNEDLGLVRTALGDVLLVRNPRTLRGGISLNF